MNRLILVCFVFFFILTGCGFLKSGRHDVDASEDYVSVQLDTIAVTPELPFETRTYRATPKRTNDLVHTKLEITIDWEKRWLNGAAYLTLTPYWESLNRVVLDAKGFSIDQVGLVLQDTIVPLSYSYDTFKLVVELDTLYSRGQMYTLFINYVAKPDELLEKFDSIPIGDKGLYFINPMGLDPYKPKQLWTQGQTQNSSCWFPTIDNPNEKTTQEIYLTVDTNYVTLSNGELIYSSLNSNGTRTDYWKMDQPHAPYLFMIAVGEFAVVRDYWGDLEVDYYVEKEYAPFAKQIFGNTPEMLTYFSELLGYPFPWVKYAQVVVRDFVSGAMENTTATVHFEGLQLDDRAILDETNEDYIAHELAHQWFGDLVTCESWANLPLNESFATYCEYLWIAYKYGNEEGDYHFYRDLRRYLSEAKKKQEPLIRYYFETRDDMFDRHSYQKGARVVHLLRDYVGDEAFFEGLKRYLHQYAFKTAEIHDLRMVFESVIGEDLNWFFDQWFLNPGHPQIDITYNYIDSTNRLSVDIDQILSVNSNIVYKMPMDIDIYYNGQVEHHRVMVDEIHYQFNVNLPTAPDLVNVDARKVFLGEKTDNKSTSAYVFQYRNAPLMQDRLEAVIHCYKHQDDSLATALLTEALDDKFWAIRKLAIDKIKIKKDTLGNSPVFAILKGMSLNDPKSQCRAAAIKKLNKEVHNKAQAVYEKAINDSSYLVEATALKAISDCDSIKGFQLAKSRENSKGDRVIQVVADIYADNGTSNESQFFEKSLTRTNGYAKFRIIKPFGQYLIKVNDPLIVNNGVKVLQKIAIEDNEWWMRYSAMSGILDLKEHYVQQQKQYAEKINEEPTPNSDYTSDKIKLEETNLQIEFLQQIIDKIKAFETDDNLLRIYNKT